MAGLVECTLCGQRSELRDWSNAHCAVRVLNCGIDRMHTVRSELRDSSNAGPDPGPQVLAVGQPAVSPRLLPGLLG